MITYRAWLVRRPPFGAAAGVALAAPARPPHTTAAILAARGELAVARWGLAATGGHFPWVTARTAPPTDVQRVHDQVGAHAAALDHLAGPARASARPGSRWSATTTAGCTAPCSPTATTGFDAGAPGGRRALGDCFATYWLELEGDACRSTPPRFAGLEPVDDVAWLTGGSATGAVPVGRRGHLRARRRGRRTSGADPRARSVGSRQRRPRARRPAPRSTSSALLDGAAGRGAKLKHVLVLRPCGSPTPRR